MLQTLNKYKGMPRPYYMSRGRGNFTDKSQYHRTQELSLKVELMLAKLQHIEVMLLQIDKQTSTNTKIVSKLNNQFLDREKNRREAQELE